MIGRWLKAVDKCKLIGAVFLDLAKAFDLLDHELLLYHQQKDQCYDLGYIKVGH
jgi:hypothetical protein